MDDSAGDTEPRVQSPRYSDLSSFGDFMGQNTIQMMMDSWKKVALDVLIFW
jgi:hypothetical protein